MVTVFFYRFILYQSVLRGKILISSKFGPKIILYDIFFTYNMSKGCHGNDIA